MIREVQGDRAFPRTSLIFFLRLSKPENSPTGMHLLLHLPPHMRIDIPSGKAQA